MDYDIKLRVLKAAEIFLADKSTVQGVAKKVDCSARFTRISGRLLY